MGGRNGPNKIVEQFCRAVWRHEGATIDGLVARVDPDGADRWGHTPLLMAAEYGDLALVKQLVRRGAPFLHHAAQSGCPPIVAVLLDHDAALTDTDPGGETALEAGDAAIAHCDCACRMRHSRVSLAPPRARRP
jgi:ankyrin repeat protein